MSRRRKLEKFEALNGMPHVFQNYSYDRPELINHEGQAVEHRGSWNQALFQREAPLVLELACGRGEYSIGLADLFPNQNYIGVDIKGARIYQGALNALKKEFKHVGFLRTKIECIEHFFGPSEVDTIWIVFPDPFLKSGKENRRLTAPPFLERYKQFLKPGGSIKLKTDSPELYAFTHEVIEQHNDVRIKKEITDIHNSIHDLEELNIITYYEKKHIADGKKINYLEFGFN